MVLAALAGAMWCGGFTLVHLDRTYDTLGPLVDTRPEHPAAKVILEDMPGTNLVQAGEHDGAMYYAIARDPWSFDATSRYLDEPRYRYRRFTLPLLGWLFHPTGGGQALVASLFLVGLAGVFVGGLAMGALSTTLGGPAWLGLLFGLLPGSFYSLRLTDPDALATALALLAVLLLLRGRVLPAIVAGSFAVLAKEFVAVVLIGVAVARRDRASLLVAGVPLAVTGGWYFFLAVVLPPGFKGAATFAFPFSGWWQAMGYWYEGAWPMGFFSALGGVTAAGYALWRHRLRHILSWSLATFLGLAVFFEVNVMMQDTNATRTFLPLWACALLVLFAPPSGTRPAT